MIDLIYIPGGNPKFRVNEANKLFYEHPYSKILITGHSAGLRNNDVSQAQKSHEWLSSKILYTPEQIIQINEGVDAYSDVVYASQVIEDVKKDSIGKFSVGVVVDDFYKKRLFKQIHKVFDKNEEDNNLEIIPYLTNYSPTKSELLKEKVLDFAFEREYSEWAQKPKINDPKSHLEALKVNHLAYRKDKQPKSLYDHILTFDAYLNK